MNTRDNLELENTELLQQLVEGARGDLASPHELAKVAASFEQAIAEADGPSQPQSVHPSSALASAASSGLAWKLVGVALVSATALFGGVTFLHTRGSAPGMLERAQLVMPDAFAVGPRAAASETNEGSPKPRIITAPAPNAAGATAVVRQPQSDGAQSSAPRPPASTATMQSLSPRTRERELLDSARAAVTTNPSRALELCNEHARDFPRGLFSQEREVIAIDALVAGGQSGRARQRAEDFLRRNPSTGHRLHLETLLGRRMDTNDPRTK